MSKFPKYGASDEKQPPPIFGTWTRFYLIVVLWLLAMIVLFYLFTRHFS